MARGRREQLSAWQRRNVRAQSLGYQNYYDYRAHDYGKRPPGEPRPTGELLARLRGHRGRADLVATTKVGDILTMGEVRRDEQGRLKAVRIDRIEDDGGETQFWLSGGRLDDLEGLTDELDEAGARFLLWYPSQGEA